MNNEPIHVLILVQSHGDGSEELVLVAQSNAPVITGAVFAPRDIALILVVVIVEGLHGKRIDVN